MKYKIIKEEQDDSLRIYQEVSKVSMTKLYMIESIDGENGIVIIANYVFNKRFEVEVAQDELEFYVEAFDDALSRNMFLSVEFDENRGVIVGE